MRHLEKRALSLFLALLLCLTLFPAASLAEEGSISPVEGGENGGLSGTPAPTEEGKPGTIVGDGVLDVPSDDPTAQPEEPAADEIQGIMASGSCGENLIWTLDDMGLLTISGEGNMAYWPRHYDAPWYSWRNSIREIRIMEGVTGLVGFAFYDCNALTKVTIPSSVTSIDSHVIENCSSLMEILVEEGNTAYASVDGVLYDANLQTLLRYPGGKTGVTILSSVTTIGSYALQGCVGLSSVTIPEGVTTIRYGAFSGCSGLTSVTIPTSVTGIWTWVFSGCSSLMEILVAEGSKNYASVDGVLYDASMQWLVRCPGGKTGEMTIPDSVTGFSSAAFDGCSGLTSVTIPEGVTSIASDAFSGCSSLTSVTIPASVTSIGNYAFWGCASLTGVTIPEGVIDIGDNAFSGCSVLTELAIPESVTSIGDGAFSGCSSLMEILVAEGNTTYVSVDGVLYEAGLQTLLQCPSGRMGELTIPETVTIIGGRAFSGCSGLTSVTIPEGVTGIGDEAFSGCNGLTSVTIPASVTNIGYYAFSTCTGLTIILFRGDAPEFQMWVFNQDNATALYPKENATWTSDKLHSHYAEKLTWVGYRDVAAAYTIHFDANGGSDAPEDQIKGHNVDLLLTEAVPTREEASFLGWSTRRGAAEPDYLPGDSFDLNADTTLYAVWKLEAPVLPTEAVLSLGSAKVCAGQEFTVELTMEKNPGLMYLSFRLDYDTASLEFLGAEDGVFTGWTVNREKSFLAWDADGDRTENGALLHLRFRAKEEARTGETPIALAELFATNYEEELLGIGSVPGTVTILPHTPGDVNGDGEVDGRDLVRLRKYLAGVPEIVIVEANANVNGDDVVDILDLIRLRKYLVQNDVILE